MTAYKPVSLSDPLFDEITNKIKASYRKSCVLYIEEIINPVLLDAYLQKKEKMSHAKELLLFHGTIHSNISNITHNGFKAEYNKTSAYGKGTYFSIYANYSKDYASVDETGVSYILLCNVIVGVCEVVGYNQPIKKDNAVDNISKPTMYVTPYDDACYPKYLVAFHKNAK
jgi:hypothetical protein